MRLLINYDILTVDLMAELLVKCLCFKHRFFEFGVFYAPTVQMRI